MYRKQGVGLEGTTHRDVRCRYGAIDPDGDLDPIADVIDLEFADDEGSEKGTVRRV